MKKNLSTRESIQKCAEAQKALHRYKSVTVPRCDKARGIFVKQSSPAKVNLADFEKDASRSGFHSKVGDQLLRRLLRD